MTNPPNRDDLHTKVLDWTYEGETGSSSLTIARTAVTRAAWKPFQFPRDPDDLRRCLLLIQAVPETVDALPILAQASKRWRPLVEAWDQLSQSLKEEWGEDLSNPERNHAVNTYRAMRSALDPTEQATEQATGQATG